MPSFAELIEAFQPRITLASYNESGKLEYSGWAAASRANEFNSLEQATAAPIWSISKLTYNIDGKFIAEVPAGNGNDDKIWDDRAELSYLE